MKIAIVTTTINIPHFIESYIDILKSPTVNMEDVYFIIIGDLKSPDNQIEKYLAKQTPDFTVEYWSVARQKEWITKTFKDREAVDEIIPYNSIRRRNLGYLRALEIGADIIISVDDDNYADDYNWLQDHVSILNHKGPLPTVASRNKIINPCHILRFNYDCRIYSRGYPIAKIFQDTFDVAHKEGGKVVLNMGLWKVAPDIDAYTNILYPEIKSLSIKDGYERIYALAPDNYMPINTQNTSFVAELTPAFYDVVMDYKIYRLKVDRYDDIWGGLFALKLIYRMGHRVTFGVPLTRHIRNKHDYLQDFKSEMLAMALNNKIYEIVMNIDIESKDYIDGYAELASKLQKNVNKVFNDYSILKYFNRLCKAMNVWLELVSTIYK